VVQADIAAEIVKPVAAMETMHLQTLAAAVVVVQTMQTPFMEQVAMVALELFTSFILKLQ
jgi:hypothetical protein